MNYYIYTIVCNVNKKVYVGYTNNFLNRKRQHLTFLRDNKHSNAHLQSAYNLYGKENFSIDILVECEKEHAYSEEHYWCNLLNSHNPTFGFNIAPTNPNKINASQSIETIQKRIDTLTGRTLSETHIINMRNAIIGSTNSEESKVKVKQWFKDNGHPSKGVKRSEEARLKMSLASKGRPRVKCRKGLICIEEESKILIFESVKELTTHYNLSLSQLYKHLNKKIDNIITKSNIKINVVYD